MVYPGVTEVGVGLVASGASLWVVEDFWGGATAPPAPGVHTTGGGPHLPPPLPPPGRPVLSASSSANAGGAGSRGGARSGGWWGFASGAHGSGSPQPQPQPGLGVSGPAGSGQVANLNTVANQVQYLDTFD